MAALFFAAVATAGSVISVAGLVLIAVGLVRLSRARRSSRWPTTPGTITHARVETTEADPDDEDPPAGATFRPVVAYTYEVHGVPLKGDRLSFDDLEFGDRQLALDRLKDLTPGSTTPVFYDPRHPSHAVLSPGISGASAIYPLLGAGLLLLGLTMVGLSWKLSAQFSHS